MSQSIEQDALISDIFFHLAPLLKGYHQPYSRESISELAGPFSKALSECGITKSAKEVRLDFFGRL
jgi:hypothetical protein